MGDRVEMESLTRSDRVGLLLVIAGGVFAAGVTLVVSVVRIAEIVTNRDVPVRAPFVDTPAQLPVGPDGAAVTVLVDEATVRVSDMAGITVASLVIAQVALAVTVVLVVACGYLLCRNLMRGIAFSRTNSRLITVCSGVILFGWFATTMFGNMGINGAFAALSEHTYDNARFGINWTPCFVALALAVVAVAFQTGERLQRDTEGLV